MVLKICTSVYLLNRYADKNIYGKIIENPVIVIKGGLLRRWRRQKLVAFNYSP
jgi:hypothetical protein